MKQLNFNSFTKDFCFYSNYYFIFIVFVNDIILIYHSNSLKKAIEFREKLKTIYKLKNIKKAIRFLDIKILREKINKKLWIYQDNYIEKIINKFHLTSEKYSSISLTNENLKTTENSEK